MPKNPKEDFIHRIIQNLPDTSERPEERQRRDLLRMDIYAKIIPKEHRCELRPISAEHRLKAGPEIGAKVLRDIKITNTKNTTSPTHKTLEDLFTSYKQLSEALPDRIRRLYEFAALIQKSTTTQAHPNTSSAAKAVESIWHWATNEHPGDKEQLQAMVQFNEAGRLRISTDFSLVPDTLDAQHYEITNGWKLTLGYPLRFQQENLDPESNLALLRPAIAALMLATDYASEASDAVLTHPSPAPSGLTTRLFAHVSWQPSSDETFWFPWPTPEWESFADFMRLAEEWAKSLRTLGPSTPEQHAHAFLRAILRIGMEETSTPRLSHLDSLDWPELAEAIAHTARQQGKGLRQRALAEWSIGRAGLLAAPESGLSPETANRFLVSLRSALGQDWEEARKELNASRHLRQPLSEDPESRHYSTEKTLDEIDKQFPRHQFSRVLATHTENINNLITDILNQILPWELDKIIPNARQGLAIYLTTIRKRWLDSAPPGTTNSIHREMRDLDRIKGMTEKRIERLWKGMISAIDEPGLLDAVRAHKEQIEFRSEHKQAAEKLAISGSTGHIHVANIRNVRGLRFAVRQVKGITTPIIQASAEGETSEAIEAIFRIAYDQEIDRLGLRQPNPTDEDSPTARAWPGLEVWIDEKHCIRPWPILAWQTLREHEELELSWNEAVKWMTSLLPENTEEDPRFTDALARWLISNCSTLNNWHTIYNRLDLRTQGEDLQPVSTLSGQTPKHPIREGLQNGWRRRLALMAAPESGLSTESARAFLAEELPHTKTDLMYWNSEWKDFKTWSQSIPPERIFALANTQERNAARRLSGLFSLRKQRMVESGVPKDETDDILDEIDRRFSDHPWVQLFGLCSEN